MRVNMTVPLAAMDRSMPMIKVWPSNDVIRKLIKHPTGVGFNQNPNADPAEWPEDQFTTRRIQDGDVLTSAPTEAPAAPAKKSKLSLKFDDPEK